MANNFRMDARNVFLTYAQCNVTKEDLGNFFQELEGDKLEWFVIASELHEDGNPHLHVQLQYEKKKCVRRADYYDFREFHPNFSPTRSMKKVGEYVTKDEDYLLWGIEEEQFRAILRGEKGKPKYAEVLASRTYEEACEVVQKIDPRAWVNNGDRIRENLRYTFNPKFQPYLLYDWCTI